MVHGRRLFLALTLAMTSAAVAQEQTPAALWDDFNHYVLIARPELAQAAGAALLNQVDDEQLLDIVEASTYADKYQTTLLRAGKIETLSDIASELTRRIQAGRLARARDPERILEDIKLLAEGARPQYNAIQRLKAAGQFAAPALLNTLLDETQANLHPYVLAAMVQVGRPLVYPLSVALGKLEAVPQGQVAQVLAEIGYPRALPYLADVIESSSTDPNTRQIAVAAFEHLARIAGAPSNASAAELFLTLGQNHYSAVSRGHRLPNFDVGDQEGMVWEYIRGPGLVAVPVPGAVFGDVLAMRAAMHALDINRQLDPALSLWLMANLRRENTLIRDDLTDPSYSTDLLEPMYYLKMAGPLRQHDVLDRAINDRDSALALDAIEALRATAGTDALINRGGTVQPLLRALSYPDRRVRFAAAFALTNARPDAKFPGSFGVVPVLAEALRQSETRYAVVIGRDQDAVNKRMAMMDDLGYEAIGGTSLGEVIDAITGKPGIDLIVTDKDLPGVERLISNRFLDYKLAAVPMLVLASPALLPQVNVIAQREEGVYAVADTEQAADLRTVIDDATTRLAGEPISADEAHAYADTALTLLREITIIDGEVFDAHEALPSLIQALDDDRDDILIKSAHVIALIDDPAGQFAVAEAALDLTRPIDIRIALLNALAASATHIGNHLNDVQLGKLLELVKTSDGDMALAAARAHGALTLPTANVIELLIPTERE